MMSGRLRDDSCIHVRLKQAAHCGNKDEGVEEDDLNDNKDYDEGPDLYGNLSPLLATFCAHVHKSAPTQLLKIALTLGHHAFDVLRLAGLQGKVSTGVFVSTTDQSDEGKVEEREGKRSSSLSLPNDKLSLWSLM